MWSERSRTDLPIMLKGLLLQQSNPYSIANRDGIINCGVAENTSQLQELSTYFTDIEMKADDFKYGELQGSKKLRGLIADLFNRHLSTTWKSENLSLHNGCGSTIEQLIFTLCDVDDEVIIFTPFYGGFLLDLQYRMQCKVIPIHTKNYKIDMAEFELAFEKYSKIKAVILCHPENPTGKFREEIEILNVIKFCKMHNLHLISDEIYGLTTYKPFYSLFHPKYVNIIDKEKTHFVWSFSKDFCMNGIRVGVFGSLNVELVKMMHNACYFSAISRFADIHLTNFLSQTEKVDRFLENNKLHCQKCLKKVVSFLNAYDIPFLEPDGGFFVYVNLSNHITSTEEELFKELIKFGVYMPRGQAFMDQNIGWFRWTYALTEDELSKAFIRITDCLELKIKC
eukprot:NODE_526_length_6458_cov_1.113854.p2 type:complete len:396 gc:universal NODE_526_length_6458_cov_1.113854:6297-5110(-)